MFLCMTILDMCNVVCVADVFGHALYMNCEVSACSWSAGMKMTAHKIHVYRMYL